MMGRLDGKVAIVTGSARGLGERITRLFVEEGAHVALLDVRDEKGAALAEQLGGAATYVHCDVGDEPQWTEAIATVLDTFGRLDVLVNNAAVLHLDWIADTSAADYDRVYRVNELGTFLGVKHAIGPMRQAGGGSIVNISTIDASLPSPLTVAYSSTKFAVEGITRVAALELKQFGIRVNVINAGFGSKELVVEASGSFPVPQAAVDAHDNDQGMIDGARTVLWLASDESTIVTGAVLCADNGFAAGMPLPGTRR
jgi:3alpha(or 20beta)-hydroxysteroid dehydrogenase